MLFKMPVFVCGFTSLPFFKTGLSGVLQGSLESVEGTCKGCGSHDEEEAGCDESIAASESTSCSCPDNTKQGRNALSVTF